MEYEIKVTGKKKDLHKVFRNFMDAGASLLDRNYPFNTYYLDTGSQLYNAGFSFRHYRGSQEVNKGPRSEVKALLGERGAVSARKEIGIDGDDPRKNWEDLKNHPAFPASLKDIKAGDLRIEFATAVRRMERVTRAPLATGIFKIEASLDDIAILANEGQTGPGVFDIVLFPVAHEDELEFEIKNGDLEVDDRDLAKMFAWVAGNCIRDNKVEVTTTSKALRARQHIRDYAQEKQYG